MCYYCYGIQDFDMDGKRQQLLKCVDCHRNVHTQCSELSEISVDIALNYDWQCNDCKSCKVCSSKNDEDKIVICSLCDRGYHTFCCNPPLKSIPEDDWYCNLCLNMPSPPSSLPSPDRLYDKYIDKPIEPITPPNMPIYGLRQSPTHTAKYIESTLGRIKRKSPITEEKKPKEHKKSRGRPRVRIDYKRPMSQPSLPPLSEEQQKFFMTFGNKLSLAEADTKRGTPSDADKLRYERARVKSEQQTQCHPRKEHEDIPRITQLVFGDYMIDTWYIAPYPEEYSRNSTLYICEFCMKYMKSSYVATRHKSKCTVKYPPGDEIYRENNISIFEVDGRKNKMYCQNLCLMAKMFLDHKTLYYDVEPFLFYIMTESDAHGCHFVGYFSKEKRSAMNYNVSCILTMPIYQRRGYGQFLIDFSYLLSKRENKTGSPERPLSDLGLLSYRSYWKNVIYRELSQQEEPISIEELSHRTSLTPDDIISTLETNNMLIYNKETKKYSIAVDMISIRQHLDNINKKNYIKVNPDKLTWTPFILSRDRLAALLGQTINQSED